MRPRPFKPSIVTVYGDTNLADLGSLFDLEMTFDRSSPRLVVISDGGPFPPYRRARVSSAVKEG